MKISPETKKEKVGIFHLWPMVNDTVSSKSLSAHQAHTPFLGCDNCPQWCPVSTDYRNKLCVKVCVDAWYLED